MWGEEITDIQQVGELIIKYLSGDVKKLPWSEESVRPETSLLTDFLHNLNRAGLFSVNSQPAVNSVPSEDPVHGWGNPKGFVYQKAYLELLIHEDQITALTQHLSNFEQISYQAVNLEGHTIQNVSNEDINAVTWGIFPAMEVQQPTVVDHQAFLIWKDEMYESIRLEWMSIFPEKSES